MSKVQSSYKSIWNIAWPLMLGNLAYQSIGIVDTAFMGRVGETELATIGYISLFYLILFMLGFAYTKGTQIMIANNDGEDKKAKVGPLVDSTLILMAVVALIFFMLLFLFSEDILRMLLRDEAIIDLSLTYLNIRAYGLVFALCGAVLLSYFTGTGRTIILLVAILAMSIVNISLNYVLIFGKLGFPAMGIKGAAYASLIAEIFSFLVLVGSVVFLKFNKPYKLFSFIGFKKKQMVKMSKLSSPLVLQALIGLGAWLIFFSFIEKMGQKELAVSNVIKMLYTVIGIPAYTFGMTTNTVIGNIIGRRAYDEVFIALKRIIYFSFGISVFIGSIVYFFPFKFLVWFTPEVELMEFALQPLYIVLIGLMVYSISTILFAGVVAIGSTKVSLAIEAIVIGTYLMYCIWVFKLSTPTLEKAWFSEIVYWTLIGVLPVLYFRFVNWRKSAAGHIEEV